MDDNPSKLARLSDIIRYILYIIFWFGFIFLSGWTLLVGVRDLVVKMFFLNLNPWQLRAVDMWATFLLGLVWIVAIFVVEGYFRTGAKQGILWPRIARVYLITLAVAAVFFGLEFLL